LSKHKNIQSLIVQALNLCEANSLSEVANSLQQALAHLSKTSHRKRMSQQIAEDFAKKAKENYDKFWEEIKQKAADLAAKTLDDLEKKDNS